MEREKIVEFVRFVPKLRTLDFTRVYKGFQTN